MVGGIPDIPDLTGQVDQESKEEVNATLLSRYFICGCPWSGGCASLCRMTILIIDDEQSVRALLRTTLEAAGYEVTEAVNGRQGLNIDDSTEEFR